MNVVQTKDIARRWVEEHAQEMPGFRAAHLVGGITAMDELAPFPRTKDVDLHLIFDDGSPILESRGPLPNILEIDVDGLALEMGIKPVSDYATPEVILANPELAFHFTVKSALYDPDSWLDGLCREVMPRYADREWVDRRMEHERRGFERMLGLRTLAQQLLGPSGQLSMLGYGSTFLAGAFSVAALRPPRIGGRVFVTIHGYLQELDRLDLHERLLAIYGLDRLSAPESQELLTETAGFFDLMLVRKQAPHPFDHKLHRHMRPYLIESCQQMIDEGFPREAASWMLPYFLATTDVLAREGTTRERQWAAQRQEQFLIERRFGDDAMRDARFEELTQLTEEIFALCSGMIERNPAIRQLAFAS
ncbi:MAG TPA: hypothetical protein VFP05_17270 [Thermomicrobiales bacterium]|nr:hypothetical protein [Thermomicrobiales bacterium]